VYIDKKIVLHSLNLVLSITMEVRELFAASVRRKRNQQHKYSSTTERRECKSQYANRAFLTKRPKHRKYRTHHVFRARKSYNVTHQLDFSITALGSRHEQQVLPWKVRQRLTELNRTHKHVASIAKEERCVARAVEIHQYFEEENALNQMRPARIYSLAHLFCRPTLLKNELRVKWFPSWTRRDDRFGDWILYLGYVMPVAESIERIAARLPKGTRCLSVGAGDGLIEHLLTVQRLDLCIDAIDLYAGDSASNFFPVSRKCVCEVESWTKYNCLMAIWPDRRPYSYYALERFRGSLVVFIGLRTTENAYSYSVGHLRFLSELHKQKKKWKLLDAIPFPSFSQTQVYHPTCFVFQRISCSSPLRTYRCECIPSDQRLHEVHEISSKPFSLGIPANRLFKK
jgi:hypothetical protein